MTKNTEEINEAAWNHRTYEWWEKYNGSATSFGEKIASKFERSRGKKNTQPFRL